MKIALIVPGGVDRTGEYRVVPAILALIKRLARRHRVEVFALAQGRLREDWQLLGAQVHNVGMPFSQPRAFRAIVKEHRVAPFDVLQAVWSGSCGLIAVGVGRVLGIPAFVHVAGGELIAVDDIAYGGARTWHGRVRERLVLRAAAAVTGASAPVLAELERLGIPARRIAFGVDLEEWPQREPVRRPPSGTLRLIHVASLNPVKDQTMLLHAAATLAKGGTAFHVDIVGEDTLGGRIQQLAERVGIARKVTFHGFVPQRQLRPLFELAHVNVISSRHETGPLVLLEAAVAGVPTVGTAVGHIAEFAPHAAVAIPVGDAAGLAEAIRQLALDEERRLAIAHRAQQRALAEDADATAARFEDMYLAAIGGRERAVN